MILLEFYNRIIEETINRQLEKLASLEIAFADFDGVLFKISTPPSREERHLVTVSLGWPVAGALLQNGSQAELEKVYGAALQAQPESGYDVSVLVNLNELSDDDKKTLPRKLALLKRHILAGPFLKTFAQIESGQGGSADMIRLDYRPSESVFIKPDTESCTVIFSISFKDPDDRLFAKVFLQEFKAARRTARNAPAVSFSQREVPLELANVADVQDTQDLDFVSFVLFKGHINDKNAHATIDLIQTFRDYLHYHIKCSKAYMHERMRNRVDSLLQVLNRAKPDPVDPKAKKVWGGKTFKGPGASKSLGSMGRSRGGRGGRGGRGRGGRGRGAR
eukprot:CAMPEP_0201551718 /NCGR_PEP_ID=MMETSP0173_2-20130828/9170_1 /ASSEMBLY_ACC=CAM_ASM_000268 /TAXON_ID=218659 /ORGANISM="Vexillifera sp., Strain DIVA3 564/2" /LENGTH=333 /DNA_ID=CAMNT_0047962041 /DNA_START=30 /DNA_END=1031 /DNA_ORIENTATION=-